ncbi:sugar transporter SWEET1 isoform X1 [Cimex lectularius]|uniref:Sugar transporter SWEET1 n=1 Tax=Cimex lectularius TaxID=79782 RepID=A0A8I6RWD7_CIMLE|nr:sugar transporter SWEET1 isoform X1 [Cimex lectularius]
MTSEFKDVLAVAASFCQIIQLLSGVLVCRKFIKRGSANDVSALPFICGYTSCALWTNYGMMIEEMAITLVNILGTALFFGYVVTVYSYTTKKNNILKQMLFSILFIATAYAYKKSIEDKEILKLRFGMICCAVTLSFFAAPLANLAQVIKTKSSETLPFPVILMTMIVTLLWTSYGYLINDTFIVYPNALGLLLSCFQLFLFVIYPSR